MFTPLKNGRQIQLDGNLNQNVWHRSGVINRVIVPEGFISDGASIPKWIWPILGPPIGSKHLIPSIIHDYLCEQATCYSERVLGDAVFFKLLRDFDIPRWKRTLMYIGVRVQGHFTWRKKAGLR
jgi:hypothetical protein